MDARGRTRAQAGASPLSIAGGLWRRETVTKHRSYLFVRPDIAIAPVAGRDEYASAAVLVVETGVTSVRWKSESCGSVH